MPKNIGMRWLFSFLVALRSSASVSLSAELGREECFIPMHVSVSRMSGQAGIFAG